MVHMCSFSILNIMKKVKRTLKVNKKTYSAKTNAKGQATFKITKLTKKVLLKQQSPTKEMLITIN